jgi:hypothetical protein
MLKRMVDSLAPCGRPAEDENERLEERKWRLESKKEWMKE